MLAVTLGFYSWTPTPVSAGVEYNERISFVDDFDACTGERVSIEGVQHIVGRYNKDDNGKLHFGFTRNTNGTGLGQVSGDSYILTDNVNRSSLEFVSGEVRTFTEQYTSRFIHKGENVPNDDTLIHFKSTYTINANGDLTASVEIQSVECK